MLQRNQKQPADEYREPRPQIQYQAKRRKDYRSEQHSSECVVQMKGEMHRQQQLIPDDFEWQDAEICIVRSEIRKANTDINNQKNAGEDAESGERTVIDVE